ncbi:carbamoyltransferase HypF [Runella sp. MFBS21]|uniref:carbamoyltransferase HypF n=1 Tax=Runella sp. MFBS21 TaxID=3034018 RepID=UPI0023F8447D|nr:carbamoyltransferase HypF [Runella sp. MFBS21]MDF7820216.1 carbamoyltransferase HypF [Runella sp. MFBS21]
MWVETAENTIQQVVSQKSVSFEKKTYCIRLTGIVQGVGFRPFVYQLAHEWGLTGTVSNGPEGVKVVINTDQNTANRFLETLLANTPPQALVEKYELESLPFCFFQTFKIIESQAGKLANGLKLTPDFAMCSSCRAELHDPQNRRFRYPFITCTQCGPRYSIQRAVPYDRAQTSMQVFEMCPTCLDEYNDPNHRRFYSQTNSCPTCGIQLGWYTCHQSTAYPSSFLHDTHWILDRANRALKAGKIVAVKGIGGYLLLCDATNERAVATLRERKHRPSKPFAVLYPTLEILQREATVSVQEADALLSSVAPIVLVRPNETASIAPSVNPGLTHLGVMSPYAPLLELLAHDFGKPLVATSGNRSGSPIVFKDADALTELSQVADFIITHNREIVLPQDDSVLRFSPFYAKKIILRRSRGLTGSVPANGLTTTTSVQLSFGASQKSTFTLLAADNLHTSQYLGDLEDWETQTHFKHTLQHLVKVFDVEPNRFSADAHQGYFSTQLAHEWAKATKSTLQKIQHHVAHFAAVLAEHRLTSSPEPIAGIVWDGTGLGSDGHSWGGEFFLYFPKLSRPLGENIERIAHFEYFDSLAGDKMAVEPHLSAFSLLFPEKEELLKNKFSEKERSFYAKLLAKNTLKTSSVGRLFDAVASLLIGIDKTSYEGEAALQLEELAERYFLNHGLLVTQYYSLKNLNYRFISSKELLEAIAEDVLTGVPVDEIAAKFHVTLVKIIEKFTQETGVQKVAFSGGVFQNALLVDLCIAVLGDTHELFFHQQFSPNDECISFGQTALTP